MESEIEADASIGIQQMSLDHSGSAHLLDHAKENETGPRSAAIRTTGEDTSALKGHLLSYIDNAMKKFEHRQRSKFTQAIYPSQVVNMPKSRETDFPDIEVKFLGSSQGLSDFGGPGGHTPYILKREYPRRPLIAPASVNESRAVLQRIRFLVIGDLKEFIGRDPRRRLRQKLDQQGQVGVSKGPNTG